MALPDRGRAAEAAFLEAMAEADDVEAIADAVTEAIEGRRPTLAARLVGLLDGRVEIEPGSALERASTAARMLLVEARADHNADVLDEAWREARKRRMTRILRRMRQSSSLNPDRVGRFGRGRRR
jgi:hypothetical protein